MNSDLAVFDPRIVGSLKGPDQAINFIRERVKIVRQEVIMMPGHGPGGLASRAYLRWERRLMILHGQAMGALQALQAFGFISIAEFKALKQEVIGSVLSRAADAQMGAGVDGKQS